MLNITPTNSSFVSTNVISGNIFSTISVFVTAPQNLGWKNPTIQCGGYTNSFTATADWTDVTGASRYTYQIDYPTLSGTRAKWSTTVASSQYLGQFNQGEGLHTYNVFATDGVGNTSAWSPDCSVTYDKTPPTSSLDELNYYVTNQNPLNIGYSASDNFEIDHTDLCYYFNDEINESCTTNFNFTFPRGNGTYYFYTISTDKAGNTETPYKNLSNAIIYDTTPPTTNLINPSAPFFTGQNLLTNNLFEQDFYLPQNYSGNLEFSYRFISNDIASNDHFDVGLYFQDGIKLIKKIITDGNNTTSPSYDSGWQNISHSLTDLSNRLLKLVITVTDSGDGEGYDSSVTINNLKITSLDIRTGDTSPPQFLSLDLGSGIGTSFVDLAGNVETTHSTPVVILPPVVLNKITSSTVSLYNNTDSFVDLSNYTIDTGTTTVLTGTILPNRSFDIPLSIGTTLVKLLNKSSVVDSTTFETLGSSTWQRSSDGLGPWIMHDSPLSFDLTLRKSDSKITLSVYGTNNTTNRDYEIIYTSNGLEKGFGGTLLPNIVSQDFFLGTCSTGVCLPSSNIGSSFVVTFSGITKTFILN